MADFMLPFLICNLFISVIVGVLLTAKYFCEIFCQAGYSTAFLKSPVIAGFLRPCIYLPIHLISDYSEPDMEAACKTSCHSYTTTLDRLRPIKYMLLHELQHYKHKDILIGYLTTIAKIVYWFNPIIWYALREMQNDREVACDTSVLKLLTEDPI